MCDVECGGGVCDVECGGGVCDVECGGGVRCKRPFPPPTPRGPCIQICTQKGHVTTGSHFVNKIVCVYVQVFHAKL